MIADEGDRHSVMFHLRLLGPVDLEGPGGEEIRPVLAQPKRMALLAYLAAATPTGFHRRDRLVALFWPESDQSHARNALSQALRFLKRGLSPDVILTRGTEDVGLNPDRFSVDVTDFRTALTAGDLRASLSLYRGDLMDAFFLSDCPAFEEWLERERGALREAAAAAAWSEAHRLLAAGDAVEAERSAQRGMELVPSNEGAVREFMEALAGAGERAGAVGLYERFRQGLWHGLGLEPSTQTRDLAERLRESDWDPVRAAADPDGALARPRPPELPGPALEPPAEASRGSRRFRALGWSGLGLGVILVGTLLIGWALRSGSAPALRSPPVAGGDLRQVRLAVLPCENISPDPADAFYAEGLHEEILIRLHQVSSFRVAGRATVQWYHDHPAPLTRIAEELQADYLGTCSVRRDGGQVRLGFQLLHGGTGGQLLARAYDRDLTAGTLFEIQTEIARDVAAATEVLLSPRDRSRLANRATVSTEAYQSYLMARVWLNRRSPEGFERATRYLEAAVREDPTFAPAHAALGEVLTLSAWTVADGGSAIAEAHTRARDAAETALALDPELGAAHATLGLVALSFDWDFETGEDAFERAIETDPGSPAAPGWYAWTLAVQGRPEEALARARLAQDLDPLSPVSWRNLGVVLRLLRRPDEAAAVLERLMATYPDFEYGRDELAAAYLECGRFEDVLATDPTGVPAVAALLALGRGEEATALARRLEGGSIRDRARVRAALGDAEGALEVLEEAYRQGAPWILTLSLPDFDALRSDPRFTSLLESVGLPR